MLKLHGSEVPRLFTLSLFFAELELGVPRVASGSLCEAEYQALSPVPASSMSRSRQVLQTHVVKFSARYSFTLAGTFLVEHQHVEESEQVNCWRQIGQRSVLPLPGTGSIEWVMIVYWLKLFIEILCCEGLTERFLPPCYNLRSCCGLHCRHAGALSVLQPPQLVARTPHSALQPGKKSHPEGG